jgi:hypothetical protein
VHGFKGGLTDLDSFLAHAVALYYTANAAIAEVLCELASQHALTLKQVQLVSVCCTDVTRAATAELLGISLNSVKTRTRLLPRRLGFREGMGELVTHVLGRARQDQLVALSEHVRALERRPPSTNRKRRRAVLVLRLSGEELSTPVERAWLPRRLVRRSARAGIATIGELLRSNLLHSRFDFPDVEVAVGVLRERGAEPPTIAQPAARGRLKRTKSVKAEKAARDLPAPRRKPSWAALLHSTPPELLERPIDELVGMPWRVVEVAEATGCRRLEELLRHPALPERQDLIRGTAQALAALQMMGLSAGRRIVERSATLLGAFTERIACITDERARTIVERTSGLHGPAQTLLEVGRDLGVSRERVRQLELKALRELCALEWGAAVRERIDTAWQGGIQPLGRLVQNDPWLAGVLEPPGYDVLGFVLHFIGKEKGPRLVRDERGQALLVPRQLRTTAALAAVYRRVLEQVAAVSFPTMERVLRQVVEEASPEPSWGEYLFERVSEDVMWELAGAERARALGLVRTQPEAVMALLRASPRPMTMHELMQRLGVRQLQVPAEALYLGRTTLGLEQHIESFDAWRARLVPLCIALMREAPTRQWAARELLRGLRRTCAELPSEWSAWHLVAVLRRGEGVRYLGRQRFVLASSHVTRRRTVAVAVREILEQHGEPMPFTTLVSRLGEELAYERKSVRIALEQGGYVCSSGDSWRLPRRRS